VLDKSVKPRPLGLGITKLYCVLLSLGLVGHTRVLFGLGLGMLLLWLIVEVVINNTKGWSFCCWLFTAVEKPQGCARVVYWPNATHIGCISLCLFPVNIACVLV